MPGGRIGVDLIPLDRVRDMVTGNSGHLLKRMLSAEELALSGLSSGADSGSGSDFGSGAGAGLDTGSGPGSAPDIPGIAGRLAAKEAVFKLFRCSGETLPWLDTRILKAPGGAPVVVLSGRAARLAERARIGHITVSISHEDSFALAVALSEPVPTGTRS